MTKLFESIITEGCGNLGIELDKSKKEQLYDFYQMVAEKNKVMNLTSITDEEGFAVKHVLDSLSIVKIIDLDECLSIPKENAAAYTKSAIDVGTGAGFPGMVLKIVFPGLQLVLFDSLQKRLAFLDHVISELSLQGVSTLHGRAEDLGTDRKHREKYDYAFSRAVANMTTLSEYCMPFVKPGGAFAAYKSADSNKEINDASGAISLLGGKIDQVEKFVLPGTDIGRSLIIVKKIRKTPPRYPRKAGVPARNPLTV